MSVDLATCNICGDEYVTGFDGEHAADAHKTTIEIVADLLNYHWDEAGSLTDPRCACGWSRGQPTNGIYPSSWEVHFIRVLAREHDR